MKVIKLLFLFILPYFAFGQKLHSDCKCPLSQFSGTKSDTTFFLSHNYTIALCGYKETSIIKGKTLYREFVLSVCGSNKIIKFWDAMQVCNLKISNDSLLVETLIDLPVGKAMSYQETVWTIEHVYFNNNILKRDSIINPQLPKYTLSQVAEVLKMYKNLPNDNSEKIDELADKLFISALSNSKEAAYYLINFRKKFTNLDGVTLEGYDGIMEMFNLWRKQRD